jgi:hypothetical protein
MRRSIACVVVTVGTVTVVPVPNDVPPKDASMGNVVAAPEITRTRAVMYGESAVAAVTV